MQARHEILKQFEVASHNLNDIYLRESFLGFPEQRRVDHVIAIPMASCLSSWNSLSIKGTQGGTAQRVQYALSRELPRTMRPDPQASWIVCTPFVRVLWLWFLASSIPIPSQIFIAAGTAIQADWSLVPGHANSACHPYDKVDGIVILV